MAEPDWWKDRIEAFLEVLERVSVPRRLTALEKARLLSAFIQAMLNRDTFEP